MLTTVIVKDWGTEALTEKRSWPAIGQARRIGAQLLVTQPHPTPPPGSIQRAISSGAARAARQAGKRGIQRGKRHLAVTPSSAFLLDKPSFPFCYFQGLTGLRRRPRTLFLVSGPRRRHRFCRLGLREGGGRHLGSCTCRAAARRDGGAPKTPAEIDQPK